MNARIECSRKANLDEILLAHESFALDLTYAGSMFDLTKQEQEAGKEYSGSN